MKNDDYLDELTKQREELQTQLVGLLKPHVVDEAIHRRVINLIRKYTTQRRKLGYLNRIPQELGRYADSLEGLVRAEKLTVGNMQTMPQEKVDDEYYQFVDANGPRVELTHVHKEPTFYSKLEKILYQKNTKTLVKAWLKFAYRNLLSGYSHEDCVARFFRRRNNKPGWKLEVATHVRTLAKMLKEDANFYGIIKEPIKKDCRRLLREIELRIGEGRTIVPDVETTEPSVSDFVSNTALIRNVERGKNKAVDEVLRKMENLSKKIQELEHEQDPVPN